MIIDYALQRHCDELEVSLRAGRRSNLFFSTISVLKKIASSANLQKSPLFPRPNVPFGTGGLAMT